MRNLLDKALNKCESAELFKKEEYEISLGIVQRKVQGVRGKNTTEIALRLIKDNNMGSAVSTSTNDESIIDRALISNKYQKCEAIEFAKQKPEKISCFDPRVKNLTSEEMIYEGQKVINTFAKISPDIIPDIHITKNIKNTQITNSNGFDYSYDSTNYSFEIITRTSKGFTEVHKYIEAANFNSFSEDEIAKIIHEHKISQNRVHIETKKMPVIFSGKAMGSLMLRFLSGVKGENIVKKISPLHDKLNQQIFAEGVIIRDNGRMEMGLRSCPFDDEGNPTNDTTLIENGVLKTYLVGYSDGKKLGLKPTGNSFKRTLFSQDIEDAPSIDSTNMIISGLNIPDDELIKGIDRGIYVDSVMGAHTGNMVAGEYSLNISCGYLIEKGRFTGKVMDAMVAGNIYDTFKNITAMGTKLEPMNAIFYSIGYSPAVLFKEISVVGK